MQGLIIDIHLPNQLLNVLYRLMKKNILRFAAFYSRVNLSLNSLFLKSLLISCCYLNITPAYAALPIEYWVTKNSNTRVYFVANRAIPMLDIQIMLDAGNHLDPSGQEGLAALTANSLNTGIEARNTGEMYSESQIADRFADVGALYSASSSTDFSAIQLRVLSTPEQREPAIDLLSGILQRPSFPKALIERNIQMTATALREALSKPQTIASRQFLSTVYGTHPYGQSSSLSSLDKLSQQDVTHFYQTRYGADRAVIILIGDIDRKTAEGIAEKLANALPSHTNTIDLPAVHALTRSIELRLPHPSQQTHILIGQAALKRADPDYFALLVGNHILGGGGFTSRLTKEIREQRGLSYSVYSYFFPLLQEGIFQIGLQTRKDQAEEARKIVQQTLNTFMQEGPTPQEIQAAKDNLINGLPLRLDSNAKLLANIANIAWYGLPLNYLDTWTDNIKMVTLKQIRTAFAKHLQPQWMATIMVGPSKDQE